MNSSEISLIITAVLFPIAILVSTTIFVIRFSHPEDDTGVVPKIIAIICISFSFTVLLCVPFGNAIGAETLGINGKLLFLVFAFTVIALLLLAVPFSLFFFKAAFVGTGSENLGKRLKYAFFCVGAVLVVFLIVTVPMYFLANKSQLDFPQMSIAAVSFVAWFPFSVLLGTGFVAMPSSLFNDWYYRPTPIMLEEYTAKQENIGNKAKSLREEGEKIKKSKDKNFFERRKKEKEFVQSVMGLKEQYRHLQIAYHFKGGNPIVPWFKLVLSIFSMLFCLIWIVQIILAVFVKKPFDLLGKFLNSITPNGFYVASSAVLLLFGYFLLSCTAFGLLHVSAYVPFLLAGYKLESQNTYNDAFIVNAALMLLMSLPTLHFLADVMPEYTSEGFLKDYFVTVNGSSFFGAFYENKVFYYVLGGSFLLSFVLYFVWPPKSIKRLRNEMRKIED